MTEIKINWIHYKNFKGFKDFKLELNGNSAKGIGPNGSGKTSLADGFLWLLFDKDTTGKKPSPKPLDDNNEEILGLEPTVEAELIINNEKVLLKKILAEKWTAPRGQLEKTRGNDQTNYYIDEVPKKEKEFKAFVESINNPIFIQMLIDAGFFMRMDWKDRRDILISLTGLTDAEIIDMDPELKDLEKILDGKTIEEKKKMLQGEKKKVKSDIEGLPGRIQENTDAIARLELDDLNKADIEKQLKEAQTSLDEKEQLLASVESGAAASQFNEEVTNLRTKLSEAKNQFLTDLNFSTESLQKELSEIHVKGSNLKEIRNDLKLKSQSLEFKKDSLAAQREILLSEHKHWKDLTFDEHKKECAMCGQTLPEDEIAGMVEKFNSEKSEKLESNMTQGKKIGAERKKLDVEISENLAKLEVINKDIETAATQYKTLNEELTRQRNSAGIFEESETFKSIQKEIDEVQQKILVAKADSVQGSQEFVVQRDLAKAEVERLIKLVMKFDQVEPIQTRIEELKQEDGKLKTTNQKIEQQLWLIDEFTRKKVKYLTDSINSHFEKVEFKLFEVQKNEAIKEVCEATINGVGYSNGASTGERGKCDLDIVSGLSRGLDIRVPLFLDNAESITTDINFNGQLVQLFAKDEKFRVEVEK